MPLGNCDLKTTMLLGVFKELGLTDSMANGKRIVKQNGLRHNNKVVNINKEMPLRIDDRIKFGQLHIKIYGSS